jgi:hypothetical protein
MLRRNNIRRNPMSVNETFETITHLSHKSMAQASSLGDLNLRIFERLAARHVDAMNLAVEHSVRLAKLATETNDFSSFFKDQVEATNDLSELLFNESKENLKLVAQARDDYRAWFEKILAEMSAEQRKDFFPAKKAAA